VPDPVTPVVEKLTGQMIVGASNLDPSPRGRFVAPPATVDATSVQTLPLQSPPSQELNILNTKGTDQSEGDEWELGDDELQEGSTLSGSKFLIEDPPRVRKSKDGSRNLRISKQAKGPRATSRP
jgi:hypothetical protein